MTAALLNLLLWPGRLQGELTGAALRAHPVFGPVATAAAGLGLLLLGLWIYRPTGVELPARRRGVLLALRLLALACLVPALLELSLDVGLRRHVRPVLALAVDRSRSMSLEDRYSTEQDRQALAAALAVRQPGNAVSRIDLVKGMLAARDGARLSHMDGAAELHLFSLDRDARFVTSENVAPAISGIDAAGDYTSLAGSLNGIVARLRGQPTAGILLFSDGANNTGASPLAVCGEWRQAGVPIHTVAVGDPNPKDIEVRQVLANRLLFVNDPATIVVRLRQRGFEGRPVTLVLRRGAEELERAEATFKPGESELNFPFTFTPKVAGEHTFRVECPALPDEAVEQNNHRSFVARVTSEKLRVLYVEGTPRWQYRFLRDAMDRDRRLDMQIMLTGAEPVAKPNPPFISALPESEEALAACDLIVLGDVDPAIATDEQMEWMVRAVRDGGTGLLLLAGPNSNPRAYVDTPLGDLLPVEPAEEAGRSPGRPRSGESERFRPELSPLGRTHPAVQLADELEINIERWASLPEVFWFAPARKARAGAAVLVAHPTETTETVPPEALPLMAVQHFGRGRVFYCGIDETWRWRLKQGDRNFYRLWGQVIQYLGSPHLAGGRQGLALRTDRATYSQGETALVTARIDEIDATQLPPLVVEREDGQQMQLSLTPAAGAERLYESRLPLPEAGLYKLWIEGHALDASAIIQVEAPQLELQEPAADVSLMRQIAENTGGQHCRPGEFDGFIERLDLSPRMINERNDYALWDRPLIVLLFVCLLGTEWALRRLWQLP